MKKVLLLVSKFGSKNKFLVDYLRNNLGEGSVDIALFSDLFFDVNQLKAEILMKDQSHKLSDYSFIYFRGVSESYYSIAGSVALYLNHADIDYADKIYQNLGSAGDKFTALLRMAFSGLPIIHTVFCMHDSVNKNIDNIIGRVGLPLIAKEFVSQHGVGIRSVRSREDFVKLKNEVSSNGGKQFMFQKFIEIDKEYRFLVMGDKVRSVQQMYRDTSKYKLSIDMNRQEEFLPVAEFSEEMKYIAVKAAKVLNLQVAGVDLAVEKGTGKVFLFEVNRGPGFTYDTKVSPEIPELTKFITEKLGNENIRKMP